MTLCKRIGHSSNTNFGKCAKHHASSSSQKAVQHSQAYTQRKAALGMQNRMTWAQESDKQTATTHDEVCLSQVRTTRRQVARA